MSHIVIMSDVSEIDFHIGTDCPFCFKQCNYSLSGRPGFFYEKIYDLLARIPIALCYGMNGVQS